MRTLTVPLYPKVPFYGVLQPYTGGRRGDLTLPFPAPSSLQSERFFTQGLFLRPSCHPDEFQAEFLQRIISPPLEWEKILMSFFCNLKFLLIFWLNYLSHCLTLVQPLMQHFWGKLGKPLEKFAGNSKSWPSSNRPFIQWSPREGFVNLSAFSWELHTLN